MLLKHLHGPVYRPSPDQNDHIRDPVLARPPTSAIVMASIASSSRSTKRPQTPAAVAFVPFNSRCTATMGVDDCRRFPISREQRTGQPSHHRSACPRRRESAAMRQQQSRTSQIPHHTTYPENQLALAQDDQVCRAYKALEPTRGDSPGPLSVLRQHQFYLLGTKSLRPAWSQSSRDLVC